MYEHILLVMQRFEELKGKFSLSPQEEKILYWAVVLHDIGKPAVAELKNGAWRSTGHEKAGVPLAWDMLLNQPEITPYERRKILELVRWHFVPREWAVGRMPDETLNLFASRTDLRLLGIFGVFDLAGRISKDQARIVERAFAFHEIQAPRVAYELGTFESIQQRYQNWGLKFKNAAWNAVQLRKGKLLQRLFEVSENETNSGILHKIQPGISEAIMGFTGDQMGGEAGSGEGSITNSFLKKVYLTIGPPFSGKTTYLNQRFPDAYRIHLDDFKLTEDYVMDDFYLNRRGLEFKHLLNIYLRRNGTVVIEGRNLHTRAREELNKVFRDLNAEVHYLIFETPLAVLEERNKALGDLMSAERLKELFGAQSLIHPWEAHNTEWIDEWD